MKAYLFSIGESTTELAKWSLERLGHEVIMLDDPKTSFYEKYREFLNRALNDKDNWVIRTDADVIVNKRLNNMISYAQQNLSGYWWVASKLFCFLRMDIADGAPNVINKKALKAAASRIHEFSKELRPETALTRIPEFMSPRRFLATDYFCGIHGYKQSPEDIGRVLQMKAARNQLKDWDNELIEKLNSL